MINESDTPSVQDLSILQFNVVSAGLENRGLEPWGDVFVPGSRGNCIAQLILSKDADIVCLQELNRFEELSKFLSNYNYEGRLLLKMHPVAEGIDKDGAAIFWKASKFVCSDILKLEGLENWNQICLCCLLENGTRKIAVASTHLKAYQTRAQEKVRCEQANKFTELYEKWLQQHEKSPDLTLFVGDLNSTPDKTEKWKGAALTILEKKGYKSSWHVLNSKELKDTDVATFSTGKSEVGLYDHIFFKTGLTNNVSVKYCDGPQEWTSKRKTSSGNSSDHLPLFVTFQFN